MGVVEIALGDEEGLPAQLGRVTVDRVGQLGEEWLSLRIEDLRGWRRDGSRRCGTPPATCSALSMKKARTSSLSVPSKFKASPHGVR